MAEKVSFLDDAVFLANPDDLTAEEIAEIRAGIRCGLTAASEGRERPVAEYAKIVRKRRHLTGD